MRTGLVSPLQRDGSERTSNLDSRWLHAQLLQHRRPYILGRRAVLVGRYWLRQPHERDFEAFALFPDREGLFLDVGANSGISAVSFRAFNRHSPIVSVEPNPLNEPDLRIVSRLLNDFKY